MVKTITTGDFSDYGKYPLEWVSGTTSDKPTYGLTSVIVKGKTITNDEVFPDLLSDTLVKQEKKIKELEERIKAIEETTLKTVQAILNGTMDKTST